MANLITSLSQPQVNTQQTVSNTKKASNKRLVQAASIAGSAFGIAVAVGGVYALAKKGNPAVALKNLTYDEKDVLLIGAGSVLGGLAGGLLADKDENNKKPKLREATQQFFGNMVCPFGLLAIGNSLLEKSKFKMPQFNATSTLGEVGNRALSALPKVAVTITALVAGMEIGNKIMNFVNNKIFKEEVKHDVHAEDYIVHTDDLCVAANLLLKDVESISSVTSKLLPLSFIVSGAKTGMQQADSSSH